MQKLVNFLFRFQRALALRRPRRFQGQWRGPCKRPGVFPRNFGGGENISGIVILAALFAMSCGAQNVFPPASGGGGGGSPAGPVCASLGGPTFVGTEGIALSADAKTAYVSGDNGSSSYLNIVNVTTPCSPVLVGTYGPSICDVNTVLNSGNYIYLPCAATSLFYVINVTSPAAPTLAGSVTYSVSGGLGIEGAALSAAGYVYGLSVPQTACNCVRVFNVNTPSSPTYVTSVVDNTYLLGAVFGIAVNGTNLFVTAGGTNDTNGFLTVLDISTPGTPTVIGHVTIDGAPDGVSISADGNTAYVTTGGTADLTPQFVIVDVTTKASPAIVSTITDISLNGTTQVISPTLVAVDGFDYSAGPAKCQGGFICGPVSIIDVTTPANPKMLSQYAQLELSLPIWMASTPDYLFVASGFFGMTGYMSVIDLTKFPGFLSGSSFGYTGTQIVPICTTITMGVPTGCSNVTNTYVNGILQ